jgi:hypothetical protein
MSVSMESMSFVDELRESGLSRLSGSADKKDERDKIDPLTS